MATHPHAAAARILRRTIRSACVDCVTVTSRVTFKFAFKFALKFVFHGVPNRLLYAFTLFLIFSGEDCYDLVTLSHYTFA